MNTAPDHGPHLDPARPALTGCGSTRDSRVCAALSVEEDADRVLHRSRPAAA